MKLIELHILQSFPVSCLNRDDVGSPKTAVFGGAVRARISSQCLKRAIREFLKSLDEGLPLHGFGGIRSKLLVTALEEKLAKEHHLSAPAAGKVAREVAGLINKKKGEPIPENEKETETLIFFSPAELEALARQAAEVASGSSKGKLTPNSVAKAIKSAGFYDAADIALFGRMVAAEPSLTLEGAAMFGHALSTHLSEPDIDFFSAVDERKDRTAEAGAGMIGDLEFISATYYRYAALNLGLLFDKDHLERLELDARRGVVEAFLRATILAVPNARHNSMNAHTLPGYVLGIVKEKGQPLQLVNAFEKPVSSRSGLMDASIDRLKEHHKELKDKWGMVTALERSIPETNLATFCKEIVARVE